MPWDLKDLWGARDPREVKAPLDLWEARASRDPLEARVLRAFRDPLVVKGLWEVKALQGPKGPSVARVP